MMKDRESPVEWVYGTNPVIEALRSGRDVSKVYLARQRNRGAREVITLAEVKGVPVSLKEDRFFEDRFDKGHQGIAALVSRKRLLTPEEILEIAEERGEAPFCLVLDGLEDPRNFGAVLRVADAAGIHGVVLQGRRSVGVTPVVAKASAGAVEYVQIAETVNIKHALRMFAERGISIVGAEAGGATSLWDADFTGPLAVVVGSEGQGLRRTVRDLCDTIVSLPMKGRVNSLNVSVACAVLAYEVLRQRTFQT